MKHGFVKVAAGSPALRLGNPAANAQEIISLWERAEEQGALCIVFPELSLTGATLGDLYLQQDIQRSVMGALSSLLEKSNELRCAALIGLPLRAFGRLYNVAALIAQGEVLALVPKEPSAAQARWFSSYDGENDWIECLGREVNFGQVTAPVGEAVLGVAFSEAEIIGVSRAGASIVLMPAASPVQAGGYVKGIYGLAAMANVGCCALVVAGTGPGESVSGAVYSGDCAIFEGENILARGARFQFDSQLILADVDHGAILFARQNKAGFSPPVNEDDPDVIEEPQYDITRHFSRTLSKHPFFRDEPTVYVEAFQIQVTAIKRRMLKVGTDKLVLAWSGGLDSTAALLAAHRAVYELGAPAGNVTAVSMPGLATSERTRNNARILAGYLGSNFIEIDISAMCLDELRAIGHDGATPDVTFENCQARRRTGIALNMANKLGALQLATGDMSELALGWCTYGGDQTGMYGVNAGIPKTMLRKMVEHHAMTPGNEALREVLISILETPVSPELTPGEQMQATEEILGAYDLHDFFLYHRLCRGAGREKLRFLAGRAFGGDYAPEAIDHALEVFFNRFNSAQFKRTTSPESPSVLDASLSPHGGYVLPSDLAD